MQHNLFINNIILPSTPTATEHLFPYQKITERFHRNPVIPPNSDIAERTFLLTENRIKVVYHLEEGRFTPSTREFLTPPMIGEQATALSYNPEMTSAYQVDPYAKDPKNRQLFELLEKLVKAQDDSIAQIRAAEEEVSITYHLLHQWANYLWC